MPRGRKRKEDIKKEPELLSETDCEPLEKKLRKIKEEINIETELLPETECETLEKKPKPRGRKRKNNGESSDQVNGNLSSISEKTANAPDNTLYKCMKCFELIKKTHWSYHNYRMHADLAWREGFPEIDDKDEKLVRKIWQAILKSKKPLICGKCGEKKKSIVGFQSHLIQCSKSLEEIENLKEPCTVCGRYMLPASLEVHMSVHNENKKSRARDKLDVIEDPEDLKGKRKSALKAEIIMSQISNEMGGGEDKEELDDDFAIDPLGEDLPYGFIDRETFTNSYLRKGGMVKRYKAMLKSGNNICLHTPCDFQFKNVQEICQHFPECCGIPNTKYICTICTSGMDNEDEMLNHAENSHTKTKHLSSKLTNVKDDSLDPSKQKKAQFLVKAVLKTQPSKLSKSTYLWTLKFIEKQFTKSDLYLQLSNQISDWISLSQQEAETYLPTEKTSVDVSFRSTANTLLNTQGDIYSWKRFNLFESCNEPDSATAYCGGPVQAVAWAPSLSEKCDQYLAVCTLKSFETSYYRYQQYTEKGVIQFWNFGELFNTDKFSTFLPQLELCLAHNCGTIWNLEWCPSGCRDYLPTDKLRRLGLLSICCTCPAIYIYSICHPKDLDTSATKVFYTKPKFKLILSEDSAEEETMEYVSTKSSWSKLKGHSIIAGGFSNGVIGLYDLHSTSALLRSCDNGTIVLKPYQTIATFFHPITSLVLYHEDNNRYLVAGSYSRSMVLWDLFLMEKIDANSHHKRLITDAVWPTHWPTILSSVDHITNKLLNMSRIWELRTTAADKNTVGGVLIAPNSVLSLSWNDWVNGLLQANCGGDLYGMFPVHLYKNSRTEKNISKRKYVLGYIDIVEKHMKPEERTKKCNKYMECVKNCSFKKEDAQEYIEKPVEFREAKDRYGLVITNFTYRSLQNTATTFHRVVTQSFSKYQPDVYPLFQLNQVAWNPNQQSFKNYALGMQSGFIQVRRLDFLVGDHDQFKEQDKNKIDV